MDLLKQLEKLAEDNKYGLVRMRVVHGYAPYEADGIYGFSPDEALRLYDLKEAFPVDAEGNEIVLEAPAPEPEAPVVHAVDIPVEWKKLHYLQRIKLAKELIGGDVPNKDVADDIIAKIAESRGIAPADAEGEGGAPAAPSADA